ncbi:small kinetochore-associated protein [Trichomycterus rosablanca]|uniref:small kinetochore-associated protein n=1 Tax=Trichomycterus rosablanca TaxID=2290929 RepID=UPI002F35B77B
MKRVEKPQLKDTAIPTLPHFVSRKANLKSDSEKKTQAKTLKGPSVKYGQQNDLREQNRILVATNEDLQRQILELKESVALLEERCSNLQDENAGIKKQLRDCHVLLIAEKLDPVSGEKIEQAVEQKDRQREDVMTVSQKLLTELKLFDEFAREHGAQLAEMQNTMKSLNEAREKLHTDRESFCLDAEEMEKALKEAERLLIE